MKRISKMGVIGGFSPLWVLSCLIDASQLFAADFPRDLSLDPGITELHVLSQNWSDEEANSFYNLAQGSQLIPYAWFLHLEQPDSEVLFRDVEHIRSLGYLPRKAAGPDNADGLPIGFVRDGKHLGLTCAACHTAQINHKGEAWLVDGAPTLGDFETFLRKLVLSLEQTSASVPKFERFAAGVLGASDSVAMRAALKQELAEVVGFRKRYNERNLPRANVPSFGPGRVDAFGAIMNEVTSTFAQLPANHFPASAPVSYPFLWDTPQHDKVQWNGAAENDEVPLVGPILGTTHVGALGRNIGEVLGVFAKLDAATAGFLGLGGYPSSVQKANLIAVEESLRKLWSPQWPAEFGSIDPAARQKGKQLFSENCAKCHDDAFKRTSPDRRVIASMSAVGTDPLMAANFATRRAKTGKLQGRLVKIPGLRFFGAESNVSEMLVHTVQRAVLGKALPNPASEAIEAMAPTYSVNAELQLDSERKLAGTFTELDVDADTGKVREVRSRRGLIIKEAGQLLRQDVESFEKPGTFFSEKAAERTFDIAARANTKFSSSSGGTRLEFTEPVAVTYQYKGRPLNGIWATAPYLHNGSVPNLDELLKSPAKRIVKFKTGSREFDPKAVGFRIDEGSFEFDTSLPGNSNAGHEYPREFTPEEREHLITYMKSL